MQQRVTHLSDWSEDVETQCRAAWADQGCAPELIESLVEELVLPDPEGRSRLLHVEETRSLGSMGHPERPVPLWAWVVLDPVDEDGCTPVLGCVQVLNGADREAAEIHARVALQDAQGQVRALAQGDDGPFAPSERQLVHVSGSAQLEQPIESLTLWLTRRTGSAQTVSAPVIQLVTDESGDLKLQCFLAVDNPGTTASASLLVLSLEREDAGPPVQAEIHGDGVPPGRSLVDFDTWLFDDDCVDAADVASVRGWLTLWRDQSWGPDWQLPDETARAAPAPTREPEPEPEPETPPDPWALVASDRVDEALALLQERGVDAEVGRELRALLRGPHAAAGARLIGALGYRSGAAGLRKLLSHSDARVRASAAQALGHVGGPSATLGLRRLLADDDASVQQAASAALDLLEG
jgi:hypothetical protein